MDLLDGSGGDNFDPFAVYAKVFGVSACMSPSAAFSWADRATKRFTKNGQVCPRYNIGPVLRCVPGCLKGSEEHGLGRNCRSNCINMDHRVVAGMGEAMVKAILTDGPAGRLRIMVFRSVRTLDSAVSFRLQEGPVTVFGSLGSSKQFICVLV